MSTTSAPQALIAMIVLASLSACGWVDAIGTQGEATQTDSGEIEVPIRVPIEVPFESDTILLQSGIAADFLENARTSVQLDGSDGSSLAWEWELIGEGEAPLCESINGFDPQFAANSLAEACTFEEDCAVDIQETSDGDTTDYIIQLPHLRAAVALEYALSAESENGASMQRQQIICALSVNEAPITADDTYRALAGVTLIVEGQDANNLLANESDDDDARNLPLQVDINAVEQPRFADIFTLESQGGFTYRIPSSNLVPANGELVDSFVYSVSDGLHSVDATATIRIVANNSVPSLTQSMPTFQFDLSAESEEELTQGLNLTDFFNDPDNDPLFYSLTLPDLRPGVTINIDEEQMLIITIDPLIYESTDNGFMFEVNASDELAIVSAEVSILIADSSGQDNQAPIASDIRNRRVANDFEYDVSVFFEDPDGDTLIFSSDSLPADVQLSSSGIISGSSSGANRGPNIITITATDPFNASASDSFRLTIN